MGTRQQQTLGKKDSVESDAEDHSLPLPWFWKEFSAALKQFVGWLTMFKKKKKTFLFFFNKNIADHNLYKDDESILSLKQLDYFDLVCAIR